MRDRLRVGIVGVGRVGIDWHLPDIRAAGGEVVALADAAAGRAARFATQHGVPYAFDRYQDLIALPEVDIVAVCTPPYTHAEIAVATAETGKHLYLEKPPAMNAAEMVRIAEAVRRAGIIAMSGSNRIYEHQVQALKRRIEASTLGHVYMVECLKLLRGGPPQGWQRERRFAGGGVGFNSAAHRLDLVLYLLGTPGVVSVTARTYDHLIARRAGPDTSGYVLRDVEEGVWTDAPIDVEDTLVAMIQFETGCTCLLRDASAAHMAEDWQVRVYGTEGGASLSPLVLYGQAEDGLPVDTCPHLPDNPTGMHVLAYRHLFDCIHSGRPTSSPPERSIAVMRILDAIYASANAGGRQVMIG